MISGNWRLTMEGRGIHRFSKHRRLVWWTAGEGREVNRILPHRHRPQGHDGKRLDGIVVARVVAIGTLKCGVRDRNGPLQNDFCSGWNIKGWVSAPHHMAALSSEHTARTKARSLSPPQRHDGGEDCLWISADHDRNGHILPHRLPLPEVFCSTTMGKPARDQSLAIQRLQP